MALGAIRLELPGRASAPSLAFSEKGSLSSLNLGNQPLVGSTASLLNAARGGTDSGSVRSFSVKSSKKSLLTAVVADDGNMTSRSRSSVASAATSKSSVPRSRGSRCPICGAASALPTKKCPRCAGEQPEATRSISGSHSSKDGTRSAQLRRDRDHHRSANSGGSESTDGVLAHLRAGPPFDMLHLQEILTSEGVAAVNIKEEVFGWTPLLIAASAGDPKLLALLLDSEADVGATCLMGNTALHVASRQDHISAASQLLVRNADLEARNCHGWTALTWSAIAGCQQLTAMLLDASADIENTDGGGRTAAMWAARHGHKDLVVDYLAMGIDLTLRDNNGLTLQDHAVDYEEMRRALGLDKPFEASDFRPPSAFSLSREDLKLSKAPKNQDDDDNDSLVAEGSESGSEGGASRAGLMASGQGAMYWAMGKGSAPDLSRLMVQHGARSTATTEIDAESQAPDTGESELVQVIKDAFRKSRRLLKFAKENNWESAEDELRAGACACTRTEPDFLSPLMWAAKHEAPVAAMSLFTGKAKLDQTDALGWTALHHAVHAGSDQTVSVLHHLGADMQAKSHSGDTALHLAAKNDSGKMVQLICTAVRDMGLKDAVGNTPMHLAAARGSLSSLRTLLRLKADVAQKGENGRTAFALAAHEGQTNSIRTFFEPTKPLDAWWDVKELDMLLQQLPWIAAEVKGHRSSSREESGASAGSLGKPERRRRKPKVSLQTIREDGEADPQDGVSEEDRASSKESGRTTMTSFSKSSRMLKSSSRKAGGGSTPTAASRSSKKYSFDGKSMCGDMVLGSEATTLGAAMNPGKSKSQALSSPIGLMRAANSVDKVKTGEVRRTPADIRAFLSAVDDDGRMPLALAASNCCGDTVHLLLERKAQVDATDNEGNTALLLALVNNDTVSVTHLLAFRASVDVKNKAGLGGLAAAATPELYGKLKAELGRATVEKRLLRTAASLPALPKLTPGAGAGAAAKAAAVAPAVEEQPRLRLDGLPEREQAQDVEDIIYAVMDACRVANRPVKIEVAEDPIMCWTFGYAFLDFRNDADADEAQELLNAKSTLSLVRVPTMR